MENNVPAPVYNKAFLETLDEPDGHRKIAAAVQRPLRQYIDEEGFWRQVMPPKGITPEECDRSQYYDTLVRVEDIEPLSYAMACTLRGNARSEIIYGQRFVIPFFKIETQHHEKTEGEIMAYRYPITNWIQNRLPRDIETIEDREALIHLETGIQMMQYLANGSAYTKLNKTEIGLGNVIEKSVVKSELARQHTADDFIVHTLQKPDFAALYKRFPGEDGERLRAAVVLVSEFDMEDLNVWTIEDVGFNVVEQTAFGQFKAQTLVGRRYVRTNKTSILRPGNLYGFTDPEFFGYFYELQRPKFYIKKEGDRVVMWSWEFIGMGFGNLESAKKLELYSGSVTPTLTDTGYEVKVPKAEDEIMKQNARALEGYVSPKVVTY